MSTLETKIHELTHSVWAASAFGAAVDAGILDIVGRDWTSADRVADATGLPPSVVGRLCDICHELGFLEKSDDGWRLTKAAETTLAKPMVRGLITGLLRGGWLQGHELWSAVRRKDDRLGSWYFDDPELLEIQGRPGRTAVGLVVKALEGVPGALETISAEGGRIADVGCGTGWIAIGITETWPNVSVVGIDPHQPALEIARRNIAELGLSDRISLHEGPVQDVREAGTMTGVWLPMPFFTDEALASALEAALQLLKPGGWVFSINPLRPAEGLARAVVDLRDTLWGGGPRTTTEALDALRAAGFTDVQQGAAIAGVPFELVAGRRPA